MFPYIKLIHTRSKLLLIMQGPYISTLRTLNLSQILSADVIGFAESRLCTRDTSSHFALKNFKLMRMDETGHDSVKRPYQWLALYIKDCFEIQKVEKIPF